MGRNVIGAIAGWLKDNPILSIAAALVTLLGLIKAVPPAWDAGTQILDIPSCVTYAPVYSYSSGRFSQNGEKWVENIKGTDTFDFKMAHRDRDYIFLLNLTPRVGYDTDMLVRLPVCGGTAQWTLENPEHWTDLYQVWRGT